MTLLYTTDAGLHDGTSGQSGSCERPADGSGESDAALTALSRSEALDLANTFIANSDRTDCFYVFDESERRIERRRSPSWSASKGLTPVRLTAMFKGVSDVIGTVFLDADDKVRRMLIDIDGHAAGERRDPKTGALLKSAVSRAEAGARAEVDRLKLAAGCARLGVPHLLIRSKSGNGWHFEYLLAEPLAAKVVRRFGAALLVFAGLPADTEVFPKADELRGDCGSQAARPGSLRWFRKTRGSWYYDSNTLAPTPRREWVGRIRATEHLTLDRLVALGRALGIDLTQEPPIAAAPQGGSTVPARHGRWNASEMERFLDERGVQFDTRRSGSYSDCAWTHRYVLVTCPTSDRHSSEDHGGAAVLVNDKTGKVGFKCHHAGCNGVGWKDIKTIFDPGRDFTPRRTRSEEVREPPLPKYAHPERPVEVSPEEAAPLLQKQVSEALRAPPWTIVVLPHGCGVGKTTATIEAARSHAPIALFSPQHSILREHEATARARGIAVAKSPEINDETCPEGHADDLLRLINQGYDANTVICDPCPRHPKSGNSCPRFQQIRAVREADLRLGTTALLRPHGPKMESELARREGICGGGAKIVLDEDFASDIVRSFAVSLEGIARFRELLSRALAQPALVMANQKLRDLRRLVEEVLSHFRSVLSEGTDRVIDIAKAPCPSLVAGDDAAEPKVERLLAHEVKQSRSDVPNLLPIVLHAARTAARKEILQAVCSPDRFQVTIRPRTAGQSILVLNATTDTSILKNLSPEHKVQILPPIRLRSSKPSRLIQYRDRMFSLRSLRTREEVREAGRIAAAAIRRHLDPSVEAPRIAIITYKAHESLVEAAVREGVPNAVIMGVFHFYNLRGTNALAGCDVLVVLGTPRPGSDAIRQRALAMGATIDEVNACKEEKYGSKTVEYCGKKHKDYGPMEDNVLARAAASFVGAELLQATGRQRRERHGGVTIILSSFMLPLPLGDVELRALHEDGLLVDPRRDRRYLAFKNALLKALQNDPFLPLSNPNIFKITGVMPQNVDRYLPRFVKEHPEFTRNREVRKKSTAA